MTDLNRNEAEARRMMEAQVCPNCHCRISSMKGKKVIVTGGTKGLVL